MKPLSWLLIALFIAFIALAFRDFLKAADSRSRPGAYRQKDGDG